MHPFARRLRERFHNARARLFIQLMQPKPGMRLLDLGGYDGSFAARIQHVVPVDVTVADLESARSKEVEARGFQHVTLTGDGPLPFADGEFDLVLCNSVIEHVTLPKHMCAPSGRVDESTWRTESEKNQAAFAAEIRRISKGFFVQTPHRHFPIDAHVHLPLVNFLSHNNACRVISVVNRFWLKKNGVVDWHLLTSDDMQRLFPDARIHVERLAGLPKSIVAYRAH